jgi:hypothetical protein
MLTHCPECNGQLSTDAATCPHCGAPVQKGQGAAPTARPVGAAPAYAQPMQPQPPPQQPPQSHFLRNCFICGCLLVVLAMAGIILVPILAVNKLKNSVVTGQANVTALGQKVMPGYTLPKGWDNPKNFGIDLSMFGMFTAKGVGLVNGESVIMAGSFIPKPGSTDDLKNTMMQGAAANSGGNQGQTTTTTLVNDKVDMVLGSGETVPVIHEVTQDQQGKKRVLYLLLLDPFDNELGWLGIMAMGPEDTFDLDGFKAFLGSVKTKK